MVLAILAAVSGSVVLGMFFFSDAPASDQPVYDPTDIRYTIQQEEAKQKAKHPKVVQSSSNGADDEPDSSDSSEDEEPPAEEPPIE